MAAMSRQFRQQWILALLLLSLHGVVLWGFDSALTRALLLTHYGLFLLWQPIWRGEQHLSPASAMLFLAGGLLLLLAVNWWVLAFWQAALFGLLGGRVFSAQARHLRIAYLIAAAYLLAVLLLWVVPKLLAHPPDVTVTTYLVRYFLPLLPASLLLLPAGREQRTETTPPLDFFYALLLVLLAVILVLGSFAIEVASRTDYPEALMRMLFAIAAALFVMAWLWNPRAGFAGLGQLLSRYLLSVGMPFEKWLNRIAALAESELTPGEFIAAAADEVAKLTWVSGGTWHTPESAGEFGAPGRYRATFDFHELSLTIYTRQLLTPALTLHIKLLTQLLGEFYQAKKREEALRRQSYMHAIHETGSRLTHDIKNLVQSLSALCTAAQQAESGDEARLVALIRRQLPQLNRRLELTLEKLQAPQTEKQRILKTAYWWRALKKRHAGTAVAFSAEGIPPDSEVLADVFDSVADNLLQNALGKRGHEEGLSITVTLHADDTPSLEIRDDGSAIPPEIARQLFKSHVPSESGLGIGLYHAARQAQQAGYALTLAENRDGAVRFLLHKA